MRTLHLIPIIHSEADLGGLAPWAADARVMRSGNESFESFRNSVHEFWKNLNEAIRGWEIDFKTLLLYQDSLPMTGSPAAEIEHKIVEDLAKQGSQNHLILHWLIERGANLIGTESAELLVEEYTLAKERLQSLLNVSVDPEDTDDDEDHNALSHGKELLRRRDRFIADRINQTLRTDCVGLLFLGLVHSVESTLSSDIKVVYPFGRPKLTIAPENIE